MTEPSGSASVVRRGGGESIALRWRRRAVTLPGFLVATVLAIALSPALLAAALLVDLFRSPSLPTVRLVLLALVYLVCESVGIVASLFLWLGSIGDPERRLRWFHALQDEWAAAIFAAGRRIFGLRVEVEGEDALRPGPLVLLSRHASLVDTMLPAVHVARRHGLRLRWVLKQELLWDPCLDVVGHVLPNVFVRRGSDDAAREIEAVRSLARDLGPGEGVLIYPEGTRFSPPVLGRALRSLAGADPERAERLGGLRHVLPPRPGGTLAVLEACPPADVVVLAHVGLDGAARLGDVWRGSLVGRRIRVCFRRIAGGEIPASAAERRRWLDAQWLALDEWVDACLRDDDPDAAAGTAA
ncbi:MAG: lysophospholipid acyltransferase family protein [Alphaproteobacteria bacterium]